MKQSRSKVVLLVCVSLLALVNAGCLVVAAGAAAGGAAAGYAYLRGRLYREYPATLNDSAAAVRTALGELQFVVAKEKFDGGNATFETKTADGQTLHVSLETIVSRVPAEGPSTRISVRVGTFGDDAVSARVLDQISAHLVPATPPMAASPGAPIPLQPTTPKPVETAEPRR